MLYKQTQRVKLHHCSGIPWSGEPGPGGGEDGSVSLSNRVQGFPGSMTCTFSHPSIPRSCHFRQKARPLTHGTKGPARMICLSFWSPACRWEEELRSRPGRGQGQSWGRNTDSGFPFWSSGPCCPQVGGLGQTGTLPYLTTQCPIHLTLCSAHGHKAQLMEGEPKTNVH